MALRTLPVLDGSLGSHGEETRQDFHRPGANSNVYLENPPILSSGGDRPHQWIHDDDYQIALVPRQKLNHSAEPGAWTSTLQRVFVLTLTWRELLERVRGELNPGRTGGDATSSQFGEVRVNFLTMQISKSEKPIELTTQEFKLLRFLTQAPARVFSRAELLTQVWGYSHYPSTRTVDSHICMLRQKLELNRNRPIHFLTVRGIGYKFIP
ncbi:MAG: response regulator transcription factor [Acidobacteria bacterium]|nr:response regulator transcription factor [Acidobacteriota bacterium]